MNELQKCELELLKEVLKVCENHGLKCFLIGGTTLGAIRHGGFIPWDDDIDIGLPRPDYDKLMALAKEFKDPFFLQNYITDPKYPYNFAKLRNSDTTFIEKQFSHIKMNQGVYIDIFPIDGISKKNKINFRVKLRVYTMWFRFYLIYLGRLYRPIRKKHFIKDLFVDIFALFFMPWNVGHFLNKSIEKSMKKIPYQEANLVVNFQGANFSKEPLPKEYFGDGIYKKFEDIDECLVQSNYDRYLSWIYNDYMTPPPPEKQIGHHYHRGLDLNKSYKEFKE